MRGYIGITGFMKRAEVERALTHIEHPPHEHVTHRQLMVGVLVSLDTLNGKPPARFPGRYPAIKEVAGIFTDDPRALNLIHYVTSDRKTLPEQLARLVELGGPHLHGFQLNMRWPDPATIILLKSLRVVLQLGPKALEEVKGDPEALALRLDAYRGHITDVLIDASGGEGRPIDLEGSLTQVRAIHRRHPDLGIGEAGGFCAETIDERLRPHVAAYSDLSLDAEGRLRTPQDTLDPEAEGAYLKKGQALFRGS